MVVEAHGGGWGSESLRAFAVLARRSAEAQGEDAAVLADRMAQRHSISMAPRFLSPLFYRIPMLLLPVGFWAVAVCS